MLFVACMITSKVIVVCHFTSPCENHDHGLTWLSCTAAKTCQQPTYQMVAPCLPAAYLPKVAPCLPAAYLPKGCTMSASSLPTQRLHRVCQQPTYLKVAPCLPAAYLPKGCTVSASSLPTKGCTVSASSLPT
jgi:hypothetical protein